MPFVITEDDYLEFNEVPLDTPAWSTEDYSALYDTPQILGGDQEVPYSGLQARRRRLGPRRIALPMLIMGLVDSNGTAYTTQQVDDGIGLRNNIDFLKRRVVRPKQDTIAGTRLLRHYMPDGTIREAEAVVASPLNTGMAGHHSVNAVLDLWLPGGVMRASVPDTATRTGSGELIVPHSGTADQFETEIVLSGGPVTLTNDSWIGDPWLTYLGDDPVTIQTGAFRAVLAGGANVSGLIDHNGHEQWFPLEPTDNTVVVDAPAGVVVTITHYPPFL